VGITPLLVLSMAGITLAKILFRFLPSEEGMDRGAEDMEEVEAEVGVEVEAEVEVTGVTGEEEALQLPQFLLQVDSREGNCLWDLPTLWGDFLMDHWDPLLLFHTI
jgi:hypothetical protein